MLGLLLDAYGLCICTYEFYSYLTILLFYDTMCMYVRMDYPCMYLCIYFYNICTMACDVQVSGRKKTWMSLEFLFFLLFETVLLSFAALKISPLHKV